LCCCIWESKEYTGHCCDCCWGILPSQSGSIKFAIDDHTFWACLAVEHIISQGMTKWWRKIRCDSACTPRKWRGFDSHIIMVWCILVRGIIESHIEPNQQSANMFHWLENLESKS
jgi:hypothetical protein